MTLLTANTHLHNMRSYTLPPNQASIQAQTARILYRFHPFWPSTNTRIWPLACIHCQTQVLPGIVDTILHGSKQPLNSAETPLIHASHRHFLMIIKLYSVGTHSLPLPAL